MHATIFATSSDPNFEIPDNIMYFNPTTNRFEQQGRTGDINQFSNLNNLSALTANRQEITVLNFEAGDKVSLALSETINSSNGSSNKSAYRIVQSGSEVKLMRIVQNCSYGFCSNGVSVEYSDMKIVSGSNYTGRVTQQEYNNALSGDRNTAFNLRSF